MRRHAGEEGEGELRSSDAIGRASKRRGKTNPPSAGLHSKHVTVVCYSIYSSNWGEKKTRAGKRIGGAWERIQEGEACVVAIL